MKKNFMILFLVLNFFLLPFIGSAQKKSHDNYSLFYPVPYMQMREMETDRPDVTESPYTIDAGHFQLETDLVRKINQIAKSSEINTILINQMNLKIGITNSTALQMGFQTYGIQNEMRFVSNSKAISDGYGDVTIRIKQNLVGNNSGNFAIALLPYIKFPTSKYEESRFEGGVIIPMQYRLPGKWNFGFQVEVDRIKDQDDREMHTEFLQTLTISHAIIKGIEGIAETYYTYDFNAHEFSNYLNAAVQFDVARDFKLDAGLNFGIQHTAAKHYFIGASYRL